MSEPRFGIWVPVYGPWGARHHPEEPPQPSYARALEVVRQAEQLNFEVALIGRAYLGGPAIPEENARQYTQSESVSAQRDALA